MDFLDLLQWPAMMVTVTAAWLVASRSQRKRTVGFWVFLASNVLWSIWGWHSEAYALIVLQVCLAIMNVRGVYKNDPELKVSKELTVGTRN
jgi:O-antigen/teichoic acid export membrane protein